MVLNQTIHPGIKLPTRRRKAVQLARCLYDHQPTQTYLRGDVPLSYFAKVSLISQKSQGKLIYTSLIKEKEFISRLQVISQGSRLRETVDTILNQNHPKQRNVNIKGNKLHRSTVDSTNAPPKYSKQMRLTNPILQTFLSKTTQLLRNRTFQHRYIQSPCAIHVTQPLQSSTCGQCSSSNSQFLLFSFQTHVRNTLLEFKQIHITDLCQ